MCGCRLRWLDGWSEGSAALESTGHGNPAQRRASRSRTRRRSSMRRWRNSRFTDFAAPPSTASPPMPAMSQAQPALLFPAQAGHLRGADRPVCWTPGSSPCASSTPSATRCPNCSPISARKLEMARDFPRESRLFANEMLQGAPRIKRLLESELKPLVEEKAELLRSWMKAGKINPVDPRHLIFSIWSTTQHYADFDVQVQVILGAGPGRRWPVRGCGAVSRDAVSRRAQAENLCSRRDAPHPHNLRACSSLSARPPGGLPRS